MLNALNLEDFKQILNESPNEPVENKNVHALFSVLIPIIEVRYL